MSTSEWQKSSHSYANGNCIEARWRKAAASHDANNCVELRQNWQKASGSAKFEACVEVASCGCNKVMIQVRDSKDAANPNTPILSFTRREWATFIAGVR